MVGVNSGRNKKYQKPSLKNQTSHVCREIPKRLEQQREGMAAQYERTKTVRKAVSAHIMQNMEASSVLGNTVLKSVCGARKWLAGASTASVVHVSALPDMSPLLLATAH